MHCMINLKNKNVILLNKFRHFFYPNGMAEIYHLPIKVAYAVRNDSNQSSIAGNGPPSTETATTMPHK